eukprot:TRINITY_DN8239_c0_g1_i2.p1 TRINITY_DN8239_c0_g1~~TRINITY_DN8239_c0_g1_i2.p1  ORF type:complete len:261 (-),score=61.44 TRINITY_DN8239_c0_g1_i2:7-789(-)
MCIRDRPYTVERVVSKPINVEKQIIVDKPVEKIIDKEVLVTKYVDREIETPIYVDKQVPVEVERTTYVPKAIQREIIVDKPVITEVEKNIQVNRVYEVPQYVDTIVESKPVHELVENIQHEEVVRRDVYSLGFSNVPIGREAPRSSHTPLSPRPFSPAQSQYIPGGQPPGQPPSYPPGYAPSYNKPQQAQIPFEELKIGVCLCFLFLTLIYIVLLSANASLEILNSFTFKTVSYTHLRAHETRHDLVCRLLLEKKKIYSL